MSTREISGTASWSVSTSGSVIRRYLNDVLQLTPGGERLVSLLPTYIQQGPFIRSLMEVLGTEATLLEQRLEDVLRQLSIDTATWGLKYWEHYFGLPVRLGVLDWDARRATLRAAATARDFTSETFFVAGIQLLTGQAPLITYGASPYTMIIEIGQAYRYNAPATLPTAIVTNQAWSDAVAAVPPTAWWRFNDLASPPTTNSYDASVLARADTVAYWELGETSGTVAANSVSGALYPLTYAGSPALGAVGPLLGSSETAASFDGVNDVASAAHNAALSTSSFTVQGWVYPTGIGTADRTLFAKNGGTHGFSAYVTATGAVCFYTRQAGVNQFDTSAAGALSNNRWHHVAITYDGTDKRLIIDGVTLVTAARTYTNTSNTGSVSVGGNATTGGWLAARFAKVSLHNAALTTTEVGSLFRRGRPVIDAMNNHGGGIIDAPVSAVGAINGDTSAAFDFDGTDDAVIVPYSSALNSATFSITGWIYRDVDTGGVETVFTNQLTSALSGSCLRISTLDKLEFRLGDAAAYSSTLGATSLATGARHHVAATYDGTTARVYLNGALDGSGADAYTANVSAPVRIGQGAALTEYFNGKIDELTYHGGSVLTQPQIQAMYDAGVIATATAQYKVSLQYPSGETVASAATVGVARATGGFVTLQNLPQGDPGCVARKIYRKLGAETVYTLLLTVADNDSSQVVDDNATGVTVEPATNTSRTSLGQAVDLYVERTRPAHYSYSITSNAFRAGISQAGIDSV